MIIPTSNKNDRWIIAIICLVAGLRVFFYAAAFPFFANMDEQAHLDLVIKYSNGHVPHSIEKLSTETAYYIPRYESPEYFNIPSNQPAGVFQEPPWTKSSSSMQRYYAEGTLFWSNNYRNHESSQAPLYYLVAGSWINLGEAMGIRDGFLLYWIRFLNILIIVILVIIAAKIGIELFPTDRGMNLGLPMLVGMIPQDSYYAIENDVLSPLMCGLALLFLIKYIKSGLASYRLAMMTGITLAMSIFVKLTNLPIVIIALTFLTILTLKKKETKKYLVILLTFSLVPILAWMNWNYSVFGDITASEEKIKILGWTHKSITDWYPHPIFSLKGFREFISSLFASFWRGEMIWWTKPLADKVTDYFYILSTIVFLIIAIYKSEKNSDATIKDSNRIALASFLAVVFFMAILSISFDFGNCENPSRIHPYFISGRLISGALIPFAILYLQGFMEIAKKAPGANTKLYILIGIIIAITASEYLSNITVFESRYNFFHL